MSSRNFPLDIFRRKNNVNIKRGSIVKYKEQYAKVLGAVSGGRHGPSLGDTLRLDVPGIGVVKATMADFNILVDKTDAGLFLDRMPNGMPIFNVRGVGKYSWGAGRSDFWTELLFYCPFCETLHSHTGVFGSKGEADGSRASACNSFSSPLNQYYIKEI